MSSDINIGLIRKHNLFCTLSEPAIREVADKMIPLAVDQGEIIFQEGEYGNKLYFVGSGKVEISIENKEGEEVILAVFEEGEAFGEMALLTENFRTATAKANTSCELLYLLKDDFQSLLNKHIEISLALNSVLCQRVSSTTKIISQKECNEIILLIASQERRKDAEHFMSYLGSIISKDVRIVGTEHTSLIHEAEKSQNTCFFINEENDPGQLISSLVNNIVNFNENIPGQYFIPPDSTSYQVEQIARKIAKKTIGVALSSGTAPGLAHIGVLKVLFESGIPIDYIAGTSGGALYGAMFAFGYSYEDVYKTFADIYKKSLYGLWDPSLNIEGIFKGQRVLRKSINRYIGKKKIEDSIIPFAAVATDLYSGEEAIITEGDVMQAIRSSISIPIIFTPVRKDKKLLTDGVVTTPVPVSALELADIDIKIAVYVSEINRFDKKSPNMLELFLRSRNISSDFIADQSVDRADVVIKPHFKDLKQFDYAKMDEVIKVGENAASKTLNRIRRLLNN